MFDSAHNTLHTNCHRTRSRPRECINRNRIDLNFNSLSLFMRLQFVINRPINIVNSLYPIRGKTMFSLFAVECCNWHSAAMPNDLRRFRFHFMSENLLFVDGSFNESIVSVMYGLWSEYNVNHVVQQCGLSTGAHWWWWWHCCRWNWMQNYRHRPTAAF